MINDPLTKGQTEIILKVIVNNQFHILIINNIINKLDLINFKKIFLLLKIFKLIL